MVPLDLLDAWLSQTINFLKETVSVKHNKMSYLLYFSILAVLLCTYFPLKSLRKAVMTVSHIFLDKVRVTIQTTCLEYIFWIKCPPVL